MKIHFVQTFVAGGQTFRPGVDYEVSNADAIRFINEGVARKSPEGQGNGTLPPVPPTAPTGLLKPGEQVVATVAALMAPSGLPDATPVTGTRQEPPPNNPAAFTNADGAVVPHTGFTTTAPSAVTSPPSGDRSPTAGPGTPEAIKDPAAVAAANPLAPASPSPVVESPSADKTGKQSKNGK